MQSKIPDLVLGGNFTATPYSMISASGEAQAKEYLHIKGKKWDWLVQPNREAESILCWKDSKGTSKGFAGRTLKLKVIGELLEVPWVGLEPFMYEEPCEFQWQGPWASNTESLFVDTGYDIRDRIKSWGCIGKRRSYDKSNQPFGASRQVIEELVYFDEAPQYGTGRRIQDLAQKMSDELEITLFYYEETRGGSSCGPVNYEKYSIPSIPSVPPITPSQTSTSTSTKDEV